MPPTVRILKEVSWHGSGMRLPRARGADRRVSKLGRRQPQARVRPLTPRGLRAGGAGNLKIKSKQTERVGEGERLELRGNDPGSHSSLFFHSLARECRQPGRHSPPSRAVAAKEAFRGNSCSLRPAAPPPPPFLVGAKRNPPISNQLLLLAQEWQLGWTNERGRRKQLAGHCEVGPLSERGGA